MTNRPFTYELRPSAKKDKKDELVAVYARLGFVQGKVWPLVLRTLAKRKAA